MGELFDRFDVEPKKGKDITIGERFPEVFVSETDEVYCYLGICLCDEERRNRALSMHPYYMIGLHSTDERIRKEIKGFYRVVDGCIILDDYVDSGFCGDRRYKRLDAGVRLASPASCAYAVFVNREEDEDLTRAIFGLTYCEMVDLLEAYAKMMGTYSRFITYPKLTRSIKNTNFCDITELWIPETFPYIAFDDSGYDFSHVSFYGFYRNIQFLTGCKLNSFVSRTLVKLGSCEDVLKRIFNIGRDFFYQTKVTNYIIK